MFGQLLLAYPSRSTLTPSSFLAVTWATVLFTALATAVGFETSWQMLDSLAILESLYALTTRTTASAAIWALLMTVASCWLFHPVHPGFGCPVSAWLTAMLPSPFKSRAK